jgi:nitric oxide reductase NorD protein
MSLESRVREILKKKEFEVKGYTSGSYKQAFKLKSRRIGEVIPGLMRMREEDRERILAYGERVAKLDLEAGFFYFLNAPRAMEQLPGRAFDAWVERGIDIIKSNGIAEGKKYFKGVTREIVEEISSERLTFKKVRRILTLYLQSLSGESLELDEGRLSTDGGTIYLPSDIGIFQSKEENFKVYKIMTAQSYGLIRYGSFDISLEKIRDVVERIEVEHGTVPVGDSDFERFFSLFPDPHMAVDIYCFLENHRVEGLLKREFKGLARDIEWLRESLAIQTSAPDGDSPEASARSTVELYRKGVRFEFPIHWGRISLEEACRHLRERGETKSNLHKGKNYTAKSGASNAYPPLDNVGGGVEKERSYEIDSPRAIGDTSSFVKSLRDGEKLAAGFEAPETELQVEVREEDMDGAYIYDEWDYKLNRYRASWCILREKKVKRDSARFVEKCLEKYGSQVYLIRRQFEMLRPDNKKIKKQIDGEDIDIDSLAESYADIKAGITPTEKLYTRLDKRGRDIATAFLVDLSGSTTGWVIETEKEALVLLCEGLEKLGDRYAIYGFSGKTRKQCDFYIIKDFSEAYDEVVKERISGIDAFDYTRMGPAIRHTVKKLGEVEARNKIMVVLSDGKPEDFDQYKGEHGIQDTRKALIEARQRGVRPFCITIDKEARDYIQRLFGDVGYIILDDISRLAKKLPEIYKRLST